MHPWVNAKWIVEAAEHCNHSPEDDNSSPWKRKWSTRSLRHALIYLGMCLKEVNGRMWCLTDQETSHGQQWLDQRRHQLQCALNTSGSPDTLKSCLVPGGRADVIWSDGCSNTCSAREVYARWDRRRDAATFPKKVLILAGMALALLQATAGCQNGSHTN